MKIGVVSNGGFVRATLVRARHLLVVTSDIDGEPSHLQRRNSRESGGLQDSPDRDHFANRLQLHPHGDSARGVVGAILGYVATAPYACLQKPDVLEASKSFPQHTAR